MNKIVKKIFLIGSSAMMSLSLFSNLTTAFLASASVEAVLLGDANDDDELDMSDYVYIMQYLYGSVNPSSLQVTAMDINEDCVIDSTDASIIQYMILYDINPSYVYKELYVTPDNSGRYYYEHQCSSIDPTSYSLYYLSSVSTPNNNLSVSEQVVNRGMLLAPDERDYENINVVELSYGNNDTFIGSGFIIDNHVVATAAHCVYNSSGFISDLKVNIYNSNGEVTNSNLLFSSDAEYIHIPKLYVDYLGSNPTIQDNYDYALIYVEDDLFQQGITGLTPWNIGIATTEFMNTNGLATTSGFRWYNNILARYYDEGNVLSITSDNHNLPALRITTNGTSFPGKSGGVLYYQSSYSSYYYRSAIAIVTGAADPQNGGNTWATKITPTLLKFYFHNYKLSNYS